MAGKLFEEFIAGFANAVTDVREKVVEEPWFGRAVTDTPPVQAGNDTPSTFQEFVQPATRDAPVGKDDISPEPDHDIDR